VRLTRTLLTPSGQSDLYSKASVYSFQEQSRAKKVNRPQHHAAGFVQSPTQ